MQRALDIHLNRDGPHSIEVESPSIEVDDDFDIVLRNHSTALHVHLNPDDDLAAGATLSTANHFVEADTVTRVRLHVDEVDQRIRGRLKIVTGYGAETAYATITVVPSGPTGGTVPVDEQLATPPPKPASPTIDPDWLPVIALAIVALLVGALAVIVIGDPVVRFGVLVVILGVAIAGAILWGDYRTE